MGNETALLSRRGVLAGGAALGVAATVGLAVEPAEAAVLPAAKVVIKKLTLRKVVAYKYYASTRVTKVTKYKKTKVVARIAAGKVYLKNAKGAWVQIPYVWSKSAKALVYSRYVHLGMIAAAKKAAEDAARARAARDATAGISVVKPTAFVSSTIYLTNDWARHLLRRAGFGPTPDDLADVNRLGYVGWLEQQLDPSSVPDAACTAFLNKVVQTDNGPKRILPDQSTPIWKVRADIRSGKINGWEQQTSVLADYSTRALLSKRQLLTVMEDFWGNHFNVTVPGDNIDESRAHYAYTIRTHAFGKFSTLLRAISKHPSMLTYLNNRESTYEHPNENQGRELLELHTVGVDGGYGETGVLNASRVLTGLSVDEESGEYEYKPWYHWTGPVQVLGWGNANASETNGEAVADSLFDYLAHHPTTAKRISRKLAVRFVSDNPSAALINLMAATYLKYDTAIVPVLRVMFSSAEFATSIGKKTYRPFEHLMSTARLMQVAPATDNADAPEQLVWMANDAGHNPFGQPFPTGQADTADAWGSTAATLIRWNNALSMIAGWYPNDVVRPPLLTVAMGPTYPATHGALVDQVATRLFGRPLVPSHRAAVLTFLGATDTKPLSSSSSAVSGGLPNFVAVLLDSPYQMLR
ncbi:MAG: DUF1800 domain-containing protein [Candidatus Nanopelagicales bacterium]